MTIKRLFAIVNNYNKFELLINGNNKKYIEMAINGISPYETFETYKDFKKWFKTETHLNITLISNKIVQADDYKEYFYLNYNWENENKKYKIKIYIHIYNK